MVSGEIGRSSSTDVDLVGLGKDADADVSLLLEEREEPKGGEIAQTFRLMFSCRMLKYIPIIIWSAASLGVLSGLFIPFICSTMPVDWNNAKQTKYALLCMVFLGVGEIVGAIVIGKLHDKLKYKKVIFVHLVLVSVAFAVVIFYN